MAIDANVPNIRSDIITASGGWSATPSGGPIIFNGSIQFLGDGLSPGSLLFINGLGTFRVTSASIAASPNGDRATCGITCAIGWASKTGGQTGLAKCVKFNTNVTTQDLVSELCELCGLPNFSVPGLSTALAESVWLKEGQSAFSLLSEVITAAGCVFYSVDGLTVRCELLSSFINGFSSAPTSANIIEYSALANAGQEPSGAVINGVQKTLVGLPASISTTSTVLQSSFSGSNNVILPVTTNKSISYGNRSISTTVTTTSPDPYLNTTVTINETYETKAMGVASVPYDVRACYPVDPARLLAKTTTSTKSDGILYDQALTEFLGSLNLSDTNWIMRWGIIQPSTSTQVVDSIVQETWSYNTNDANVTFGLPVGSSGIGESATYRRNTLKSQISIASSFSNPAGGCNPDFIANRASATMYGDTLKYLCLDLYSNLIPYESETIDWYKQRGKNRWTMTRRVNRALIAVDPQFISSNMKKYIQAAKANNIRGQEFFDGYLALRQDLQFKAMAMVLAEKQDDEDSGPPSTKFPNEQETFDEAWVFRSPLNGDGGVISLSANQYVEASTAVDSALAIADLELRKQNSVTATIFGSLLKVGDCDSPSFSIDVNGIKSTGVFI